MDRSDLITGNRIFEFCEAHGIPYAKTDFIGESGCCGAKPILVTHNGGYNVRDSPPGSVALTSLGIAAFVEMPEVVRWFCLNNESTRPQTTGIPLGIENWEIPSGREGNKHFTLGSEEHENPGLEVVKGIEHAWRHGPCKRPSVMLAWRTDTAPYERGLAQRILAPLPWCKWYPADVGASERLSPYDFIGEMAQHQFVACPDGNGIDCHRVWEALYVGTCPIVKRRRVWEAFAELYPIWMVDDWREVSRAAMDARWDWFQDEHRTYKLSVHFWVDRLLQAKEGACA